MRFQSLLSSLIGLVLFTHTLALPISSTQLEDGQRTLSRRSPKAKDAKEDDTTISSTDAAKGHLKSAGLQVASAAAAPFTIPAAIFKGTFNNAKKGLTAKSTEGMLDGAGNMVGDFAAFELIPASVPGKMIDHSVKAAKDLTKAGKNALEAAKGNKQSKESKDQVETRVKNSKDAIWKSKDKFADKPLEGAMKWLKGLHEKKDERKVQPT
jgi:hypothetical protein